MLGDSSNEHRHQNILDLEELNYTFKFMNTSMPTSNKKKKARTSQKVSPVMKPRATPAYSIHAKGLE